MSENKNDKDKIEAVEIEDITIEDKELNSTDKELNPTIEDINLTTDDKSSNRTIDVEVVGDKEKKEQEGTNKEEADSKENELDKDIEIIDYTDNTVESIDFESDDIDLGKLGEVKSPADKRKSVLKEIWSYVSIICGALIVAYLINTFILINAVVPTSSMENTIMAKSRILGNRMSYIFSDPQRGDIAVFRYPLNESQNFVKRVIGLPGETVKIEEGLIYIYKDGELIDGPLDEPYLKEEWTSYNSGYEFHIPEDSYLMLGDNRNKSWDARRWYDDLLARGEDPDIAFVKKDKIIGKVYFVYWYKGLNFDWVDGQDVNY